MEEVSPSQGGPTPSPEALKPELADPGAKVRSMNVSDTDVRLHAHGPTGLSLCKEEGVGASQAFYRPFSFQVKSCFEGHGRRLWETPLLACP